MFCDERWKQSSGVGVRSFKSEGAKSETDHVRIEGRFCIFKEMRQMVGKKKNRYLLALAVAAMICGVMFVFVSSLASVQAATVESPYEYGDASEDGSIDSFDLAIIQNMILEKSPVYPSGDANADGSIDSFDLAIIQNIILQRSSAVTRYDAAYDFSIGAGTVRWTKSSSLSDLPPVLANTFDTDPGNWIEATSENYINISEEHTTVWTIVASSYAALQCKFTVDEQADASDITSIGVYFNGSAEVGGDILKFWVWDFTTAEWKQIGTGVSLSTSNESYHSGWTTWGKVFANYIDINGSIYILIVNNTPGSDLNVNYIRLDLVTPTPSVAPTPVSTETVLPTSTPQSTETVVIALTPTPTATETVVIAPTPTPTATETVVITPTPTPTATETVVVTPTPTSVYCEHTYDFINVTRSSGPHDAYYLSVYNMPPPKWRWYLLKTEATDEEYAAISASDDSRWQAPNPGCSLHALVTFEMVVEEDPASISKIDLVFEGYGQVRSDFEIWAYNFAKGKGERIGTRMDIPTGSDSVMIRSITSHCSDYINDDGKVIWGVYEKETNHHSDGYWMAIDYVKLVATCACQ